MRKLDFIGTVRRNEDNLFPQIVLPGRDELIVALADWPTKIAPATLSIQVNEDGFPDLLVLNFGLSKLYMNRGDGTFKDATELIGSNSDQQWSTSGAIADIDGDGISDAAILNYCQGADIATYVCWREQGITRSCTPLVYPADHDLFYRTSETGALVDQTSAWNAIAEVPGRGLGVVVLDVIDNALVLCKCELSARDLSDQVA